MSFTQLGYPAAFASEGNPKAGGGMGEFDPYVHGVCDTMWVDNEMGNFSVDVSLILPFYILFNVIFLLRRTDSIWHDSQSWRLPSWWSSLGGTTNGGNHFLGLS